MIVVCAPRNIPVLLFLAFVIVAENSGATCRAQTRSPRRSAARQQQQQHSSDNKSLAEGIAAFERGDDRAARTLIENALAADPQSSEAHIYLGALADRANDLPTAERHFAMAARLAPKSAPARNNYGAILLRENRLPEAAAEFEASLRLDPQQANALINLAQIRFDRGTPEDLRAADELFRRADALATNGGDATAIARALTVIALRRGDKAQAKSYYEVYAARIATDDNAAANAHERAQIGAALYEAGLLTEAESELRAALALAPSDAETIVRLARCYLARKDITAAGRLLESAVAQKIETAPIYAALAEVYEKSGHFENAIPAMRIATQLDAGSEKYRFQYGLLLANADAPAAAVIRINEALKTFPQSKLLWLALGIANFKLNKSEDAARALERAIALDANFAQAYAYLGLTRVNTGQYDEGVKDYERALKADAKLAVVHYMIADALLKKTDADLPRIEENLRQAIQLDANYAPSRVTLAKVLFRTNRNDEAAAELERAAATDPKLAEIYYQLGRVYGRLKRTADAQTALATFKRLSDSQKQQEQDEQRDIVRRLADVRF